MADKNVSFHWINNDFQIVRILEFKKYYTEDIPVTVFLAVLSILGTVGNIHAFLVYFFQYKASNHRTFVVSLAAIDLIASALSIPFEIFDIRYSYTFTSSMTCKCFRTITHVAIVASGVLLGVIAIERYRKACKPLDAQLGPKGAIIACVVSIIGSFVFSIPAFFLYDATSEKIDNNPFGNQTLFGYDCQVSSKYSKSVFNKAYNGFYLLLSTSVFIICVIMYTFVGKALYKQMKFRKKAQSCRRRPSNSSISSVIYNKAALDKSSSNEIVEEESSSIHERRKSILRQNSTTSFRSTLPRQQKRIDRTRKITLMFLVATAVSYIGYVPNLVLLLIKATSRKRYAKIAAMLGAGNDILLRLYFLNNITNPIVYCFLDDRFRKECKAIYKKMIFWRR